jgi:hypothetical protein
MSYFTTRVELHSATYKKNKKLHLEMDKHGVRRIVTADNGVSFHLPTAEYNSEGNFNISNVLSAAKVAASNVGRKYSILVTEGIKRLWENLTPL